MPSLADENAVRLAFDGVNTWMGLRKGLCCTVETPLPDIYCVSVTQQGTEQTLLVDTYLTRTQASAAIERYGFILPIHEN